MSHAAECFHPTRENAGAMPSPAPEGMVWVPGGEFDMGSDDPTQTHCEGGGRELMKDARPIHRVSLNGFWMDATEVTNEQFARFAEATKYITFAERKPNPEEFPGVSAALLLPGSIVFTPPEKPVPTDSFALWWRYQPGADWRHPSGPDSTLAGREKFPVVHIAYDDALAYAKWAGKRLPTESEWEFAARSGLAGAHFAWGNDFRPDNKWMANIFQGSFPDKDTGEDGFAGLAPVAKFPANAYGLYDMAGNVWEWCSDWYRPDYFAELAREGALARNPLGPSNSYDPEEPGQSKRVLRGGSFLCSDQYCSRYMVGSRGKGEPHSSTNHIGFRCVKDPDKK